MVNVNKRIKQNLSLFTYFIIIICDHYTGGVILACQQSMVVN